MTSRAAVRVCALAAVSFALTALGAQEPSLRVAAIGRVDELSWSIAGSDGYPNILSELTWSSLDVAGLEMDAELPVVGRLEARARARAGWIIAGDNQDSDYDASDRNLEWSRSSNDASGGLVWDASVALGYRLRPAGRSLSFLPALGFEVAQERLRMTDGYQTISKTSILSGGTPPPVGPFPGLDSRYVATWYGPWIGGEALFDLDRGGSLRLSLGYQLNAYYAWADWNLRTDFQHPKSFAQRAYGSAFRAAAELAIPLSARVLLSLQAAGALGATGSGTDRTYLAGGSFSDTRFNGVEWYSVGGSAGLRFRLSRPPARSEPPGGMPHP